MKVMLIIALVGLILFSVFLGWYNASMVGIPDEEPKPKKEPDPEPENPQDDNTILVEIRAVNDAIPDLVNFSRLRIKGVDNYMIIQPYPQKFTAPDGTSFQVARFYDVASKNLGVLRTNPDGSRVVLAGRLYANPIIAEQHALTIYKEYIKSLPTAGKSPSGCFGTTKPSPGTAP